MTGVSTGTIATDNAGGSGRRSDGSTVTEELMNNRFFLLLL